MYFQRSYYQVPPVSFSQKDSTIMKVTHVSKQALRDRSDLISVFTITLDRY